MPLFKQPVNAKEVISSIKLAILIFFFHRFNKFRALRSQKSITLLQHPCILQNHRLAQCRVVIFTKFNSLITDSALNCQKFTFNIHIINKLVQSTVLNLKKSNEITASLQKNHHTKNNSLFYPINAHHCLFALYTYFYVFFSPFYM